ncbi:hypothetical protein, partial [Desulfogranum marinum]|uniref:hypothetical protein n=1 Tax=Desulfogranum marinum TaxID=453220 RepID=UPI0019664FAD
PKTMAGIEWNPWPESIGMGGRNEMESPAGIPWNQWPDCSGILTLIDVPVSACWEVETRA